AGRDALVFVDVERERGERAVEGQLPVVVAVGLGRETDHVFTLAFNSSNEDFRDLPEVSTVRSAREYRRSRSASSLRISSSAVDRPCILLPANGRRSPCAITRFMCSSGFAFSQTVRQWSSSRR